MIIDDDQSDEEQLEDEEEEILSIHEGMMAREVDFEEGMNPFPLISTILAVLCIVAFISQVVGGTLTDLDKLVAMGALSDKHVFQGEFWRLVSAGFLHGSPDHIFGNLVVLIILGMGCEHAFGRGQTLFLYVIAMLSGSLASLMGGRISVGASGAIFGLVGGLIALFVRHRNQLIVRDHRIGFVLVIWAGYQFLIGVFNPAIDNLCHLGGFFAGLFLGFVLQPAVLRDRALIARHPATLVMIAISCLILGVAGVFFVPRLLAAF